MAVLHKSAGRITCGPCGGLLGGLGVLALLAGELQAGLDRGWQPYVLDEVQLLRSDLEPQRAGVEDVLALWRACARKSGRGVPPRAPPTSSRYRPRSNTAVNFLNLATSSRGRAPSPARCSSICRAGCRHRAWARRFGTIPTVRPRASRSDRPRCNRAVPGPDGLSESRTMILSY